MQMRDACFWHALLHRKPLSEEHSADMCADVVGCARAGMLYCNLPHLQAKQGERVRLYLMSLGTEDGIHAPGITSSNLDWDVRTPGRSQ